MDRRAFVTGLGAVLVAPCAAEAREKIRRIGHLGGASPAAIAPWIEAFRQALTELGWRERQHFTIEQRSAEGHFERLPALAAELVRLQVDIIIAGTTPAAQAARRATRSIPIITTVVSDPVSSGLVASLARPGGNVTGLTLLAGPEIAGKYVELLKAVVPSLARVAVLWNPKLPSHPPLVEQAEIAARTLRCEVRLAAAQSPTELDSAFETIARERADGVIILPDPMFFLERVRMGLLAARNRVPAIYGLREHVDANGLMSYAANIRDLYRRAAIYVDRIFRGANPAELPVEQPTKFDFVINLKTAKALGLAIPPSLLLRADQVIE